MKVPEFRTHKKGFTLIELLVVIAIIGILSSIVLASLSSARAKGRDARRLSDIKQIQLALELYYDANSAFPPGTTDVTTGKNKFDPTLLEGPGYISKVPTDPSTGASYLYTPYKSSTDSGGTAGAICLSYHLGGTLETTYHNSLTQDVDISGQAGGGSGGLKPPSGFSICDKGGAQPATDFDGLAKGANCGGANASASAPTGDELCYDVKP